MYFSATVGDYSFSMTSVSFTNTTTPGPCVYTVPVIIDDNFLIEPVESFTVTITTTSNFVQFSNDVTNVYITDNDGKHLCGN